LWRAGDGQSGFTAGKVLIRGEKEDLKNL
jgi:hypothetical protein